MKNIFIAGTHGVGKSSFGEFISRKMNVQHFSCSTLIRMCDVTTDIEKRVGDIDFNQQLLISAYHKHCVNRKVILDGHTTIIDENGQPQVIELGVFNSLNLSLIIYMECHPRIIKDRVKERSGIIWSESYIEDLLASEKAAAQYVAVKLNLKLIEISEQLPYESIWKNYQQVFQNLGP